jgi:hypothetical protein
MQLDQSTRCRVSETLRRASHNVSCNRTCSLRTSVALICNHTRGGAASVNRVKPCAHRGSSWKHGQPHASLLSIHAAHTQLPKRRVPDCALSLTRRANHHTPPCSTVLGRSFPHACALNCRLPLARLPTSTNCQSASL